MARPYSGGKKKKPKPSPYAEGLQNRPAHQRPPEPKAKQKPEFGATEAVKGGVEKRARRRAKALGIKIGKDTPITGRRARRLKSRYLNRNEIGGRDRKGGGKGGGGGTSTPTSPTDPFAEEVNAYANLRFGEKERALAYEKMVEAQRGVNTNAWYNDLYQRSLQAAQATQAGYAAAQQAAYGQANQNFTGDQAANAQLLAQQNQQAAIRGTATDPALAQQMQQGAQVRQQQQTQFGNLTGQLGANQAAYGQTRAFQAAEQGIQAGQDVQARQRKVESLTRELLDKKGDYKTVVRGELEEAAWGRKRDEAAAAMAGVKLNADIADDQADNRRAIREERRRIMEADRQYRLDVKKFGEDVARDRYQREHGLSEYKPPSGGGGKGNSPFTPTQVRSNKNDFVNWRNKAGQVAQQGKYKNKPWQWHKNNMISGGADALQAAVIARLITETPIPTSLRKRFRKQYGFLPKLPSWQQEAGNVGENFAEGLF